MSLTEIFVGISAIALAAMFLRAVLKPNRNLEYPPGPKGLPLIGNVLDLMAPGAIQQKLYAKWGREFDSDVIHTKMLNTHIIVLNSFEVATELFDQRSALYSDRPPLIMLRDLVNVDWAFTVMSYGERWRSHRRVFHQCFRTTNFQKIQLKATHELVSNLIRTSPETWAEKTRLFIGSLLIPIAYGVEPTSSEHPFIVLSEKMMAIANLTARPGAFLVDVFPFLRHLPDWMPGAGFKAKAKKWSVVSHDCVEEPFSFVKKQVLQGKENISVTAAGLQALDEREDNEAQEEVLKCLAAVIYITGSDTTLGVIDWAIFNLLFHPEIQQKARIEIDRVVGKNRLPDFGDLESLPYVAAIVKESLRRKPVVPLGLAHRLIEDDVYNGSFMPAGSIVMGNAWAMLNDERIWKGPTKFSPERFLTSSGELDSTVKNPEDIAFGFGRRLCPGRALAISSVTIVVACLISSVEIVPFLDDKGEAILPDPDSEGTPGFMCSPPPFKCNFKPRSENSLDLINAAVASHV